jgi:hypothetical protein
METPAAQAKNAAAQGYHRVLATFAAVPDDKLMFRPSETCKSVLEIVAHVGFSNQAIAGALQGEPMTTNASLEELDVAMKPMLATITSRQQALDLLECSMTAVNSALDTVTPDILGREVTAPFGTVPMSFLIFAPGMHMSSHAAQIDYLQTVYGDLQNHFR